MRALIAGLIIAVAATVAASTPALAEHNHLHCLTTPGGRTTIAAGVTTNASHVGFTNFHANVHFGAFANNSSSSPTSLALGACSQ